MLNTLRIVVNALAECRGARWLSANINYNLMHITSVIVVGLYAFNLIETWQICNLLQAFTLIVLFDDALSEIKYKCGQILSG